MPLLFAASLLMTEPAPLDMPRAEAYLVSEDETSRLEDRYRRTDLWVSQTVTGRWVDEDGRVFTLSRLDWRFPSVDPDGTSTRMVYQEKRLALPRREAAARRTAIAELVPFELPAEAQRRPSRPRGFRDVEYWQGTNRNVIACAFLREKREVWEFALWQLADGDDYYASFDTFERELFEKKLVKETETPPNAANEREALRADARHSVAAYAGWRATDSDEFTVLDDIGRSREAIGALTNDFKAMRAKYAAALPSPLDGSNVLAVVRLYANRDEYLDALAVDGATNMSWSAAYWSVPRREIVAYLPEEGFSELRRTLRHEAFHQYFSYATSMMPTSPWLNEGYAQFFEDDEVDLKALKVKDEEELKRLAAIVPGLLTMDYDEFYDGSDAERRLKYRLAKMMVAFLEKGASKVRFDPFRDFKRDYLKTLLDTGDPLKATTAAFGKPENVKLFTDEWRKFWADM